MPLPLIGGIPWLAGVLGSLMFGLVQFFTKYLTKRLAMVAAAVVIIIGLTGALFASVVALMNALSPVLPPYFSTAASWVVPEQTPLILSTVISVRIARWVYEWNVKVIQWKLV